MGAWLGCLGAGGPSFFRGSDRASGGDAKARARGGDGILAQASGPGWSLAVVSAPGEPALLERLPGGGASVTLGDPAEAGCRAEVDAGGLRVRLSSDPFGLRGVYLLRAEECLWFASDPRLLRRVPGCPTGLDPAAVHGYLSFSHVPAPLTATQGIGILPAGSTFTLQRSATPEPRSGEEELWQEGEHRTDGEQALAAELRELLAAAVRKRLDGRREAAVFLSGGLDSSLIAALLAREGVKLHLFSLDFGPPYDEEMVPARAVAAHLGRPLHVVPAGGAAVRGALEPAAGALAQPFGDGVLVPLYLLGKAAAGYAEVVFNGEGGDQLFGGWANKPMIAAETYGGAGYRREEAYLATYHRFLGETDELYTPEARKRVIGLEPGWWVRPTLEAPGFTTLLHRLRAANLRLKGAQNIAPRCVQLAEAHGLTVRAPFFDLALARWSFSLPPELLLHGACEKYVLKRAAEPYLPAAVVWREKRGMGVPLSEWCHGPLRGEVARRLSARRLRRNGWFEPRWMDAFRRGPNPTAEFRGRRWGERLWTLLILHAWAEAQGVRWREDGAGG